MWSRSLSAPVNYVLKSTPILLGLSIAIIICEYSAPLFFIKYINSDYNPKAIGSIIYFTLYTLAVFFLLPALISKFILKQKLRDIGLRFPENKIKALVLIFLALAFLIPFIIQFTRMQQFQDYYSYHKQGVLRLAFLQLFIFPLLYFAEEFFFRGFLFINLWQKVKWHSFWITDIIFTLAHIGKPLLEIGLAIPASIIFNILTLNTKSIYPAMLVHYIMGVTLFVSINLST